MHDIYTPALKHLQVEGDECVVVFEMIPSEDCGDDHPSLSCPCERRLCAVASLCFLKRYVLFLITSLQSSTLNFEQGPDDFLPAGSHPATCYYKSGEFELHSRNVHGPLSFTAPYPAHERRGFDGIQLIHCVVEVRGAIPGKVNH